MTAQRAQSTVETTNASKKVYKCEGHACILRLKQDIQEKARRHVENWGRYSAILTMFGQELTPSQKNLFLFGSPQMTTKTLRLKNLSE